MLTRESPVCNTLKRRIRAARESAEPSRPKKKRDATPVKEQLTKSSLSGIQLEGAFHPSESMLPGSILQQLANGEILMPTTVHFIDVGQGNMVLIETANGRNFIFDCNLTDANKERVLGYVAREIGEGKFLHAFICSHRDADHMRGVKKLHARFPIQKIFDSDYPGTTTDTPEYRAYMDLRRRLGHEVIRKQTYEDFGRTRFRFLSAQDDRLPNNANAQGIVIKIEQRNEAMDRIEGSAMLPGDSDAETWRCGIMVDYGRSSVSSNILMAAHHGSISFFDDPGLQHHYKSHLKAINPAMTIISVGSNSHGHPDTTALRYYREHSTGSDEGHKVFRTDKEGTMKLTLKSGGGWNLKPSR